jgi:hypothetical protein
MTIIVSQKVVFARLVVLTGSATATSNPSPMTMGQPFLGAGWSQELLHAAFCWQGLFYTGGVIQPLSVTIKMARFL